MVGLTIGMTRVVIPVLAETEFDLKSGSFLLLASSLIEYNQWIDLSTTKPLYRTAQFAYGRYILGFGMGMVLSSGCGMRNLIKAG